MKKFFIFFAGLIIVFHADAVEIYVNEKTPRYYDAPLTTFIKLSAKDFQKLTGRKLNLKDKLQLYLVKRSMKKALRINPNMTVREFFALKKKDPSLLGGIALVIGAIILLFYVMFLVLYKP